MITFQEFTKMMDEELWSTSGPQDNPNNPGTKRKNPTNFMEKPKKAAGVGMGGSVPVQGGTDATPPQPPPPPPKKMKKR
jgi:hypothetical protein